MEQTQKEKPTERVSGGAYQFSVISLNFTENSDSLESAALSKNFGFQTQKLIPPMVTSSFPIIIATEAMRRSEMKTSTLCEIQIHLVVRPMPSLLLSFSLHASYVASQEAVVMVINATAHS